MPGLDVELDTLCAYSFSGLKVDTREAILSGRRTRHAHGADSDADVARVPRT